MPRPKVRLEARQRTAKACILCKASKIRCDSALPCGTCVKRRRAPDCLYAESSRRSRSRLALGRASMPMPMPPELASAHPFIVVAKGVSSTTTVPQSSPESALSAPLQVDQDMLSAASGGSTASIMSPVKPGPSANNSLHPSRGTDNGELAAYSFVFFLRKTMKPFVGSSRFTDGESHSSIYEHQPTLAHAAGMAPPSGEHLYAYLESYFDATSVVLDLFTAEEADIFLQERNRIDAVADVTSDLDLADLAALDVALAIGAQVLAPGETPRKDAEALFNRAKCVALDDVLEKPSLGMIRLFLLMSFYKLGACHRTAAAMYLGIATKAAAFLGLQPPHASSTALDDYTSRVWTSLHILDVLASFIQGRTSTLQTFPRDQTSWARLRDNSSLGSKPLFLAMSGGCTLIETIVQALREGSMLNVPCAEELLGQLRLWVQDLPDYARQFTLADDLATVSADRQLIISNIHISCVYYFAVILVTRPYLVAYLTSRLHGRAPDHLIQDPEAAADTSIKNSKISKLAQVCVSAAAYMAETLQTIMTSGFQFGNLCLVKSWLFGSGLVLGFSMFAAESRQDIQDAFEGCLQILQAIGKSSPQARVYHETLTDLQDAVLKYRQRVSMEVRRAVRGYMDQVLRVGVASAGHNPHQPPPPSSSHSIPDDFPVTDVLASDFVPGPQTLSLEDFQIDWTALELSAPDDQFSLNLGPLERLFRSIE